MTPDIIAIPGFSEPFASITHLVGALLMLVCAWPSIQKFKGHQTQILGLTLFFSAAVFLFSMSGVYHLLDPELKPRETLRRLDHAGIWSMILGTFSALHMVLFAGWRRWGVLAGVWAIGLSGLILELVFFESFPEWLSLSLFLALGWIGAITGFLYIKEHGWERVHLLIAGGVAYSIGAILDFTRVPTIITGVIGPHEVFHLFVIAGAIYHWRFIHEFDVSAAVRAKK